MKFPRINIPPPPFFLSSVPFSSYLNILMTVYFVILIMRNPLDWASVFLAGVAGTNFAAAFFSYLFARADKTFDRMHELLNEVLAANHHNKDVFEAVLRENQQLRSEIERLKAKS